MTRSETKLTLTKMHDCRRDNGMAQAPATHNLGPARHEFYSRLRKDNPAPL